VSRPARIVGGVPAPIATVPWIAYLADGHFKPAGTLLCGAAVVSATAVVTAAHCLEGMGSSDVVVVTGTDSPYAVGGQVLPVAGVDVDPGYTRKLRTGHDAAVVHLAAPTTAPPIAIAGGDRRCRAVYGSGFLRKQTLSAA
jgi:secreted trypsin-like serine protease